MHPSTYRDHFTDISIRLFTEPGIYQIRVADHLGAMSGHVAATVPLDLAAGIEALWPHDTDPADAIIDITYLHPIR